MVPTNRRGALALFVCLLTSSVKAQVNPYEGRTIVAIEYEPVQVLDPTDLAKAQPLKKGEPLRARDVASAIDGLFATGRFEDIAVEAEPVAEGVVVRFRTKPQWFVGGVDVEGKTALPPNRGEIESTARFTLGAPFREEDINHAIDSMTRLLKSNGFYDAAITPQVEHGSGTQEVFITFQIREGKRASYEEPEFHGNTTTTAPLVSDSTILRATGWRIPIIHWWRRVTADRTSKGVEKVRLEYEKQDRLLAGVEVQRLDYDAGRRRVRPSLNIDAGPRVKIEAVEAKVSKRVLKRYVPVFEEHSADNDLLVEGQRNLQDYFQSRGYYDASVEFRVVPPESDLEIIQYAISLGQRFKVVHVGVAGNRYFDAATIRERMFIQPAALNLRRGRYSEAFQRKDEQNISDLYKANGFRDARVAMNVDRNYRGKNGDLGVTVNISEGSQWLVEHVSVDGIVQGDRGEIMQQIASVEGQPFSEVSLASDRHGVLTWYYEHGFPSAAFKATWRVGSAPAHVDVTYTITEATRQFVRGVITSGLHTTRQSLVQRNITLKAGDPLSPVEETETLRRLYDLGVFARVDSGVENPDGETANKYILYNFQEASRYTVGAGIGAQIARFGQPSSQSLGSPAGTTGFSPSASLNVSRLNFLGLGQTITFRGVYSSIDKLASLSYQQPRFLNSAGRTLTYSLLYDNELDVRTFASQREEASVQLTQKFSRSLTGFSGRPIAMSALATSSFRCC